MKIYRWAAIAGALVLLATSPALAIDFDQRIKQLDGTEFTDGKPDDSTLRRVALNALLGSFPDEQSLSPEKKMERFFLAKRIQDAKGDLALSSEEVTTLKTLIAKAYPPLIMGQAWLMLDPGVKR